MEQTVLSEIEQKEVEAEIARAYDARSAGIEALQVVQHHRGWVSDEALQEVAGMLGMTPEELECVATFYSLIFRKPVGKHVIKVCDSISCYVMGGETLLGYLGEKLGVRPGGTTSDGLFTLIPIACLGHCDHAPAMMIDNTLIGDLTPALIEEILSSYRAIP